MDKTRVGANEFAQMRQEGDDVVLNLALNLIDLFNVKLGRAAFFPNRLGG